MNTIDDITVGWINSSVGTIVRESSELITLFRHILVTSIDSEVDLHKSDIVRQIANEYRDATFLGNGLLLPIDDFITVAARKGLFCGFDEIWCFEHIPQVPKPNNMWIVSPFSFAQDLPQAPLVKWFKEAKCSLGMGDGIGLNYATSMQSVAMQIEHLGNSAA